MGDQPHQRKGVNHPERDETWDERERNETLTERLDRNWADLLQELRVVQTGVQLLTGFLLTLPFQARFSRSTIFEQDVYLTTVACSVAATGLLITPVSLHRMLFRRHARRTMVSMAHRLTLIGLFFLGSAVVGAVLLIFTFVRGDATGQIAAGVTLGLLLTLWLLGPLAVRTKTQPEPDPNANGGGRQASQTGV